MNFLNSAKTLIAIGVMALNLGLAGCDNKEEILDVDTPSGGVEILKDGDSGEVEVDVDSDK